MRLDRRRVFRMGGKWVGRSSMVLRRVSGSYLRVGQFDPVAEQSRGE